MKTITKCVGFFLLIIPVYALSADWAPIYWQVRKSENGEQRREALLITGQLDGTKTPSFFQLDTGAQDSFLFARSIVGNENVLPFFAKRQSVPVPIEQYGYKNTTNYGVILDGSIANDRFSKAPFLINTRLGSSTSPLLGVVGLSAFSNPVLAIDFVNYRISIAPNTREIESDLKTPVVYEDYTIIGGLPALPVTTGKVSRGNFVVDTGSNSLGLTVFDPSMWREMTGRALDDPNNVKVGGGNWNSDVSCIEAPSIDNIETGHFNLGRMAIAYCVEGGNSMARPGITGVIGNASLFGRATLIFDQSNKRIGISRFSAAQGGGDK